MGRRDEGRRGEPGLVGIRKAIADKAAADKVIADKAAADKIKADKAIADEECCS